MSQIGPNNFLSVLNNSTCYIVAKMLGTEIVHIVSVHSSSASAHEHAIMSSNLTVLGPVPYFKNTFSEPSPLRIDPPQLNQPRIHPLCSPKPRFVDVFPKFPK